MTTPAGPLLLTIAIPTYNRAAFLRQTLAGIALQVFPRGQFEVLVIDNNSTDDTRAVVAEFAAGTPGANAGLAFRLIEAQHRLNIPRLFAALVLLSLTGVAIYGITSVISWLLLRKWHESAVRREN